MTHSYAQLVQLNDRDAATIYTASIGICLDEQMKRAKRRLRRGRSSIARPRAAEEASEPATASEMLSPLSTAPSRNEVDAETSRSLAMLNTLGQRRH
jgi:hypothetical protein